MKGYSITAGRIMLARFFTTRKDAREWAMAHYFHKIRAYNWYDYKRHYPAVDTIKVRMVKED